MAVPTRTGNTRVIITRSAVNVGLDMDGTRVLDGNKPEIAQLFVIEPNIGEGDAPFGRFVVDVDIE